MRRDLVCIGVIAAAVFGAASESAQAKPLYFNLSELSYVRFGTSAGLGGPKLYQANFIPNDFGIGHGWQNPKPHSNDGEDSGDSHSGGGGNHDGDSHEGESGGGSHHEDSHAEDGGHQGESHTDSGDGESHDGDWHEGGGEGQHASDDGRDGDGDEFGNSHFSLIGSNDQDISGDPPPSIEGGDNLDGNQDRDPIDVPEPSSIALLAVAFLGTIALGRRRSRAAVR